MTRPIRTRLAISIAAVALIAAACGSDDSSDTTAAASTTAAAGAATTVADAPTTTVAPDDPYGGPAATDAPATTAAAGGGVSVEVAETSLGEVLASDGLTLYIFTPDEGGTPTCLDACAGAWPPLLGGSAAAGDGVTAADITTVERPDGTTQLVYHGWPLYFYAADTAPGDVTGQGVGGNWFVIGADGTPITS